MRLIQSHGLEERQGSRHCFPGRMWQRWHGSGKLPVLWHMSQWFYQASTVAQFYNAVCRDILGSWPKSFLQLSQWFCTLPAPLVIHFLLYFKAGFCIYNQEQESAGAKKVHELVSNLESFFHHTTVSRKFGITSDAHLQPQPVTLSSWESTGSSEKPWSQATTKHSRF